MQRWRARLRFVAQNATGKLWLVTGDCYDVEEIDGVDKGAQLRVLPADHSDSIEVPSTVLSGVPPCDST